MPDPTYADHIANLFTLQDDNSYYAYLNAAAQAGYGALERDFLKLQQDMDITLDRVHNLEPNNIYVGTYDVPPGIPCTYGLVWSGMLYQKNIADLNDCVPLAAVLASRAAMSKAFAAAGTLIRHVVGKPEPEPTT